MLCTPRSAGLEASLAPLQVLREIKNSEIFCDYASPYAIRYRLSWRAPSVLQVSSTRHCHSCKVCRPLVARVCDSLLFCNSLGWGCGPACKQLHTTYYFISGLVLALPRLFPDTASVALLQVLVLLCMCVVCIYICVYVCVCVCVCIGGPCCRY